MKDYSSGSSINWRDYKGQDAPQAAPAEDDDKGLIGGLLGGLSDRNSKKDIQRLEGANDALARALSERPAEAGTQAPPSHASFPDSALQVAAQNQSLRGAMPPPAQPPPMPQQAAPAGPPPPGSPFDIKMPRPDMAALDEAYKRLGQGGG